MDLILEKIKFYIRSLIVFLRKITKKEYIIYCFNLFISKIQQLNAFFQRQSFRFYLKWIGTGLCVAFLFLFLLISSVYFGVFGKIPSEEDLKGLKQAQASLIFDTKKELIGKFYIFDRTNIPYEDFPAYLVDALIATEDVRFYSHKGIDSQSLFRVFFKSILLSDDSSGGGSTITMQLAKNIYGRKDYGKISIIVNKIKEVFIAKRIEKIYSKQEILTLYLNTVPFSDNTYGIESASQRFFGKSARKLTLNEAATLIGSLKATTSYNPRIAPQKSMERRNTVLAQMKKYDFLSEEKFVKYTKDYVNISYQHFSENEGIAPYFREQLRLLVPDILKNVKKKDGTAYDIYKDGLRIYTTIDKKMQIYAEEASRKHLQKLQIDFEKAYGKKAPWKISDKWFENEVVKQPIYKNLIKKGLSKEEAWKELSIKKNIKLYDNQNDTIRFSSLDSLSFYMRQLNLGFLALDPTSGAILSYVGGVDFQHFKYDHILQSRRQVGSTFKPIVYASAVDFGISPCSHFSPHPVSYPDYENWTPTNASKIDVDEYTEFSMAKALRESINTIAVQTLFYVGIENVIEKAKQMGIKTKIPELPSIALGTIELPMIELAKAYTTFANKGVPVNPYFIEKITDKEGVTLWEHKLVKNQQAMNENTAYILLEMMRGTINEGTAQRMRSRYGVSNDMAGKTGTTQNNRDGWFVGITPKLLMLSWVGNDLQIGFPNTSLGQGANSALPVAGLFMQKLNADKRYRKITNSVFEIPQEIRDELSQCEPVIRANFIERLFSPTDNNQDEEENNEPKERKNFFQRLFQ